MMNLRSLVTSESTAQNRYGHENIRRGRAASSRRFFTPPSPSGLACRLVLTLAVLLAGVNAAWGITWTDGSSAVDKGTFYVGEPTTGTVSFNVLDYVSLTDILAQVNAAAGTNYSIDDFWQHFFARWAVYNSEGTQPSWNSGYDDGGHNIWRAFGTSSGQWYTQDGEYWYTFYRRGYCGGEWPTTFSTAVFNISCKSTEGSDLTYLKGAKFVLYISTTDKVGATPASDSWANSGQSFTSEGQLLLKYTFVAEEAAIVDPFINEAASGCISTNNDPGEEISRELSSKEINLSGASLTGVKYVRVYLANDKGKAVDPTGLLSVKYGVNDATQATTDAKNGFYIYNGGELTKSDISITLNAGAGNFTKYKIVALLSNNLSTASIEDGTMSKEPKWQEEYTYTFTYPIYKKTFEIDDTYLSASEIVIDKKIDTDTGTGADDKYYHDLIETHYGLSLSGDAGDKALAGKWYGRWYVLNPSGQEQPLQLVSPTSEKWGVAPRRNGEKWEDYGWSISGNIVYTNNNARSNDWFVREALCRAKIFAPTGKTLDEFSGYKIVFECTNDYTSGDPEMNLRYTFEIPFTSFPGDGKTGSAIDGGTQMLTDRTVASVEVDLNTMAFAHDKVSSDDIRYARFCLVDAEGKNIAPGDMLSVSYDGATATLCSPAKLGFYVYNGGNKLDKSKFKVMLKAPSQYKKYKVVAVLANNPLANHVPNDGSAPLTEEPDWDLTYTYSFGYTVTIQEKSGNISWKKNTGMPADASVSDPLTEWGTTWDDLSSAQYVNWYVVDGDNTPQEIALGSSRQSGKWSIGLNSPFIEAADGKSVVLTGQNSFTSANWNGTWGKPSLYALAGQTFADIQNFKVICEVREEADANATPNVRYTFSFVKEFLGELKDDGKEGGETIDVANTTTSETLSLGSAIAAWNSKSPGHTSAKYARVWLTNGSTLIEPSGKLTASGMSAFAHHDTKYGFFVAVDGGVSLSNVTLTLAAGTFNNYTVHVALSTDYPDNTSAFARRQAGTRAGEGVYEPDYDFHYTFNFKYPVKTKYKTLIYDESTRKTRQTNLFKNYYEITADCNVGFNDLVAHGYVRWYLENKTDGSKIAMAGFSEASGYTNVGMYGYYRYKFDGLTYKNNNPVLDPVITLPEGVNYKDVRLVCVVTTKDGDINLPDKEPSEMQVKYVYDLRTVSDVNDMPSFVHYQGEAYKYLMESGMTDRAASRDYITVPGSAGITEKTWDYTANDVSESAPGNIRQNVHEVDYHIYVKAGTQDLLMLPFKDFAGVLSSDAPDYGPGSDTEPLAFIRWYDWNTDAKSTLLTASGSENKLIEKDWGHVAQMLTVKPTHKHVGVTFKAPNDFASYTSEITIVCDVSRYTDGFDDSYTYLLHEPTLSVRYIYHIHPAKEIATAIKSKGESLTAVENNLKEHKVTKLYEYNGKTVVSLNGDDGNNGASSMFSLRASLPAGLEKSGDNATVKELKYYWVLNGDDPVQCNQMQWYAYYDDGTTVWKKKVEMGDRGSKRLGIYQTSDLSGDYTSLTGGSSPLNLTIQPGSKIHMVACMGNGTIEMPVVWTDVEFINAAPVAIGSEPEERTHAYLSKEYSHANTLNFDDFFVDAATRYNKPNDSYENYAKIPIEYVDAQYGFCYPQLYGQDATNWWIRSQGGDWIGYGIAPLHADYTLLKSMNMPNISATRVGANPEDAVKSQSMYALWYDKDKTELYDVTHAGDDSKYGTFLYVDAADEARTIAMLEFDAALCYNSEIYYTAYIADMTDMETKPQVRFRVYTYDTADGRMSSGANRVPVVSFLTGNINSEGATAGKWHQVYGFTSIPADLSSYINGNSRHYYVDIDNFSENTNGADYCVDQISFYTSAAKVKVRQIGSPCDEGAGVEVKIVAEADNLLSNINYTATNLYYRIFKRHDNLSEPLSEAEALTGKGVYEEDDEIDWRTVYVPGSYDEATLPNEDPVTGKTLESGTSGFYRGKDGVVYFQFDDRNYKLEPNTTYFVSFFTFGGNPSGSQVTQKWGNPYGDNVCTVYSNDFTPALLRIDLKSNGTASDGNIGLGCGDDELTKTFDITVQYPNGEVEGQYDPYIVKFDYYIGKKSEFKAITDGNDPALYLEKALDHFRANYPEFNGTGELPAAPRTTDDIEFTEAMRNLINQHWDSGNGKLQLLASSQFTHTFKRSEAGDLQFAAIPVTRHVGDGKYICSPIELDFNVNTSAGAPKIEIGFGDVNYSLAGPKRVVRVGLEQLKKMRSGYKLHIPIRDFENKGTGKSRKLYFKNAILTLSATNDPVYMNLQPKVAKIYAPDGKTEATDVYVDMSRMYLPLDFSGENCEVNFHEGYYYEVSTSFYDESDHGQSSQCFGDIFFIIKVVPEFVTWDAQTVNSTQWSGNWYNDNNWKRSTRAELYKSDTQNSPSAGHPINDLYKDNPDIDAKLTDRPGFVPMKFTYVTLLGGNHSPSLFREEFDEAPKEQGSVQTGGNLIATNNWMRTDTSPSGGSSNATDDIRYDMLVRYGDHDKGGEGCFGHPTMSVNGSGDHDWNEGSTVGLETEAYDVEKFYGNICKEIYFKPGAELRLQQRLTYEKAWVEEELKPNTWYLMSAPLKGTYAGDMYVPVTDDATTNGRQISEAFQPINFSTTANAAGFKYSRTQYPIYQHSWGLKSSKVYTKTDDVRGKEYSAYLKFSTVSSNLLEWSHTFNDVQVPYNSYSGFAICAKRKAMTNEAKALIRLPKADESYDYYDWKDTSSEPAVGTTVKNVPKGDDVYGRLVFDNKDHEAGGYTSEDMEEWDIPLSKLQAQGTDEEGYTYYLVGNPFMASIDMGKFFGYQDGSTYYSYNEKLSPIYYIYKNGAATPVDATAEITDKSERIIRPLQAFIVKCKAADAPENIVFNRWAITDGNYTDPTQYVPKGSQSGGNNPTRTRALTLKATNGQGSSTASVNLSEAASDGYAAEEDATTLFDSNLSDVPVVYTVAGNKAVSIDTRSAIDIVPFGVACVASNELVSVKLSWSEERGVNRLYVLDAVTGEMTEVTDGQSVSVQPNDYGRYFLTTRGDLTAIREATAKGIVVSVRNKTVTVRSSEPLTTVRVMTTGGNVVSSLSNCGTEASIPMAIGGVYLVEAQTANNKKTMKVMVK